MTLIPLISAIVATPETATAPVGGASFQRSGYDPGARHRPLAAALAIGLPAALLVLVALSPMIEVIIEKSGPTVVRPVPLPPEPEPEVRPESAPAPQVPLTAPQPRVETPPLTPTDLNPLPPLPAELPPGAGSGPTISLPADPPAPPKFVLAQLDQRYAGGFQPDYPPREQREGIEGVASVRVLIGTDGRVKAVELIRTDSPGFFEATKRRALAKWRFKPATRGGVAEESWKEMTVRFEIRNA